MSAFSDGQHALLVVGTRIPRTQTVLLYVSRAGRTTHRILGDDVSRIFENFEELGRRTDMVS